MSEWTFDIEALPRLGNVVAPGITSLVSRAWHRVFHEAQWVMDDDEPRPQTVTLNGDLYELSVGDIDERVGQLEAEIARLKAERERKAGSVAAAAAFFKQRD